MIKKGFRFKNRVRMMNLKSKEIILEFLNAG